MPCEVRVKKLLFFTRPFFFDFFQNHLIFSAFQNAISENA